MNISGIFKNMLKIFIICWSVLCIGISQPMAQYFTPEQERALETQAERNKDVKAWYNEKRKALNIQHPTAEEKKLIEDGKREWAEKSRTMTRNEFKNAYNEWLKQKKAWVSLDPATSSDADVRAADSADYVYSEIDDYAADLEGQVKENRNPEPETTGEPEKFEDLPIQSTPTTQNTNVQEVPAAQTTPAATVVPEAPANLTQTVTINDNGNITQETNTGMVKPMAGGVEIPTAEPTKKADDDKKPEETKPADDATKKEETEPIVSYTGIYNDRQMFPDVMAVHCTMNAADVVKDMSRLEGCIRKYVTEMNNANASEALEGKKEYNRLRYSAMIDLFTIGIKKAAAVNGYEDAMNNYAESSANSSTEFDAEAVASNTIAFSTDVQNSIRELAGEVLKLEAINGFGNVDPNALGEEEKSEKAKNVEEYAAQTSSGTTQVETTVEIGGDEEIDAEGEELDEVVVTGNLNAKEYIGKFREMSDSRLAQQRAQYESIINDPTANEEMKKEAENMLRYVEYIEEERNGSAETAPEPQNNTPPATENQTTQPTQTTPKTELVDESDPVARDLMGRSDADLNSLYQDVQRDQDELSTTIFKMKQIKEKWQKQNKWTEEDEKQLNQQIAEYKDMQEYQKSIEKELKRRGK